MDVETKIKLLLGDKDIQLAVLATQLEEAQKKIAELNVDLAKEKEKWNSTTNGQ